MPRAPSSYTPFQRSVIIAISAMLTVGVSVMTAVSVQHVFLPPDDGAYGTPLWMILIDPFVLTAAAFYGAIALVIALPCALLILMPTRVEPTVPIVATVTIVLTAIGSVANPLIGAVLGLIGGLVAMARCRWD